jgi:hypothetical protein
MTLRRELSRAKVRAEVEVLFERMAERVGATFERTTNSLTPRGATLFIRLDGAACMVHVDADSWANSFLGHWHFDDRRGRLYRAGFDGHGHRPHHKATSMADHAEELCDLLEVRFGWIAAGTAFAVEAAA